MAKSVFQMNKMYYFLAAAAALLLAASCTQGLKTRTFSYEASALADQFDSECNVY